MAFIASPLILVLMSIVQLSVSEVEVMGQHMVLLPEAAVYMPDSQQLLIADLHLGKAEHFRKNGIALPGDVSGTDIDLLDTLISTYQPRKVVFLGDLFHSEHNPSWEKLLAMLAGWQSVSFHLVVGNHDILADDLYQQLTLSHQYNIGSIVCTHEPLAVPIVDKYNLCGHIHPSVQLRGKGKQSLKLPCFYFTEHQGILPAFGTFTGTHTVRPIATDRVYVIAGDSVSRVY